MSRRRPRRPSRRERADALAERLADPQLAADLAAAMAGFQRRAAGIAPADQAGPAAPPTLAERMAEIERAVCPEEPPATGP